ncbi:MAG: hypothetical protein AAB486_02625 [Patescibacteria group bacterium]
MATITDSGESFAVSALREAKIPYRPDWTMSRERVLQAMADDRRLWWTLVILVAAIEVMLVLAAGVFGMAEWRMLGIYILIPLLILIGTAVITWPYFRNLRRQLADLDGADGLTPAVLAVFHSLGSDSRLVCLKRRGKAWEVRLIPREKLAAELALALMATSFKVIDLWEAVLCGQLPLEDLEIGGLCIWAENKLNEPPAPVPFTTFQKPEVVV